MPKLDSTPLASSSRTTGFDTAATTPQPTVPGRGTGAQRTLGMGALDNASRPSSSASTPSVRSNTALDGLRLMGARKVESAAREAVRATSSAFGPDHVRQQTARIRVTVDLGKMRRNFRTGLALIASETPGKAARGGAVVKADGYGLGAAKLAEVLLSEGCRDFFVAELSEAVELRHALKASRPDLTDEVTINVLGGLDMSQDPRWYLDNDVMPVLNSVEQVVHWNTLARDLKLAGELKDGEQLDCILQFDSGMSRTGMSRENADRLLALIDAGQLPHIAPQLMMSHLAQSGNAPSDGEDPATKERTPGLATVDQLAQFNAVAEQVKQRFPGIQESLGASSTVFLGNSELGKSLHKSMVRMGATFHAQAPFEADTNPLEPTLRVTSKLGTIQWHPEGAKVGYGGAYTVPAGGATIANLVGGYPDFLPDPGLWNHKSADGSVPKIRVRTADGTLHACPFAGRWSMDGATIDASGIPKDQLKEGLEVVAIDDKVTTDQFAAQFGVGASYLQTKLSERRTAIEHVESEPVPSRIGEPAPLPSPWSKRGREDRLQAAAAT